jgi:hypothetical protein
MRDGMHARRAKPRHRRFRRRSRRTRIPRSSLLRQVAAAAPGFWRDSRERFSKMCTNRVAQVLTEYGTHTVSSRWNGITRKSAQ